jgi:hypothetical protein
MASLLCEYESKADYFTATLLENICYWIIQVDFNGMIVIFNEKLQNLLVPADLHKLHIVIFFLTKLGIK